MYGVQNAAAGLPPGIEVLWDPQQQRYFYVNHNTRTTSWEPPVNLMAAAPASVNPTAPRTATAPPASVNVPQPPTAMTSAAAAPFFAPPQTNYGMQQPAQQQLYPSQQSAMFRAPPSVAPPNPSFGGPSVGAMSPTSVAPGVSAIGSVLPVSQAPLSLTEALWDQKLTIPACSKCAKEFSFINRRHHCRCCFREFCGTCTTKTAPVPQFGHTTAVRVCDACSSHLGGNRKRCLSRLVPYFERNSMPDARKLEALGEAHELLMSGVEVLEEAKLVGLFGPLLGVAETAGVEKPNLTAKALSIVSLCTELDHSNAAIVASVPGALPKLVAMMNLMNPQIRLLAAEILCALSRTEAHALLIANADYMKPLSNVLSGQYGDAKLLDVCAETLAAVVRASENVRTSIFENQAFAAGLLGSVVGASLASQRFMIDVLAVMSPAVLLRCHAPALLTPLIKEHSPKNQTLLNLLTEMAILDGGAAALVEAKVLEQLVTDEDDKLLVVIKILENGNQQQLQHQHRMAIALFPYVSMLPNSVNKMVQTKQVGRLTALLRDHFAEDMKLMVLHVIASLASNDEAVAQLVASGGLYDVINNLPGSSVSLQAAYLAVLQAMLRNKECLLKATDAGAVQALVPCSTQSTAPLVRSMAMACIEVLCEDAKSDARAVFVGVAGAPTIVSVFTQDISGLRLIHHLMMDPVASAELLEAGMFAALMRVITNVNTSQDARALASSSLAACVQVNAAVDVSQIRALADMMRSAGAAAGAELCASFSAHPSHRQHMVEAGLVPPLVGLLLSGNVNSQRHASLALANIAYDDVGSSRILQEGGVAVLVGLIDHPVEQVHGCSVLALGNLARLPQCRSNILREGGLRKVVEKFATTNVPLVEHYCLWAMRMLAPEPGAPEIVAASPLLSVVLNKLAAQLNVQDSRQHVIAFCGIMCVVESFRESLREFPGRQELVVALLVEPGAGRDWALTQAPLLPVAGLVAVPGFSEALSALLSAQSPVPTQLAGLALAASAVAVDYRVAPMPHVVRLLNAAATANVAAKVIACICSTQPGRVLVRDSGAIGTLVDMMFASSSVDAATAICLLAREPENAPVMIHSGAVLRFASSLDVVQSVEALASLCVHAECRAILLTDESFVSKHLIPALERSPNSPHLLRILLALLQEPTFRSCPGLCTSLLRAGLPRESLLEALLVLPGAELFAEGALPVAVEALQTLKSAKALALLCRVAQERGAFAALCRDGATLLPSLLEHVSSRGSLLLIDRLLHVPVLRETFIACGGIERVAAGADEGVLCEGARVLVRAMHDASFAPSAELANALASFTFRALTSARATLGSQVGALELCRELAFFDDHHEVVTALLKDPAVATVLSKSPHLTELARTFVNNF